MNVNFQSIINYLGLSLNDYQEIAQKSVASAQEDLKKISHGLALNNKEDVMQTAHHLKGTCAALGAEELTQLAGKLNTRLKEAAPNEEILLIMNDLAEYLESFIQQLEGMMPSE